jgi:hypothetical protein
MDAVVKPARRWQACWLREEIRELSLQEVQQVKDVRGGDAWRGDGSDAMPANVVPPEGH